MHASHEHADEVTPPTDHLGIRWAVFWLVVGSAMVGTAIVAFPAVASASREPLAASRRPRDVSMLRA